LSKAQLTLDRIINKFETIQHLNHKGKQISQSELDRLQKDSLWTWIFGKDQVDIVKNLRHLEILNESNDFMRTASKNIGDIIVK
jgi:hypothetical protein